jgi:hypothetical protein
LNLFHNSNTLGWKKRFHSGNIDALTAKNAIFFNTHKKINYRQWSVKTFCFLRPLEQDSFIHYYYYLQKKNKKENTRIQQSEKNWGRTNRKIGGKTWKFNCKKVMLFTNPHKWKRAFLMIHYRWAFLSFIYLFFADVACKIESDFEPKWSYLKFSEASQFQFHQQKFHLSLSHA